MVEVNGMIKQGFSRIQIHLEWIAWMTGLILMAVMDPYTEATTLCLFEWIGISWCPGHGLGHSIAFLARGEWLAAFKSHPLGPFAVIILLYRSIQQFCKAFNIKFK